MQTLRIAGKPGDNLYGDNGDDVFRGSAGDDNFYGNGGNDRFDAGDGNDRMYGGEGQDSMFGGAGNDVAYAAGGNDYIEGGEGSDLIYAGAGDDTVYGDAPGIARRAGATYDDLIEAGAGNDRVFGGLGNDEIQGEGGDDYIVGGRDDGRLVYAGNACLDRAIDFKGGETVTLDLRSVQTAPGQVLVNFYGQKSEVLAGAITMDIGGHQATTFCVQFPEHIYWGRNDGFTHTGADEAFALSKNFEHDGRTPTLETVHRDLGLERAQVLLAQEVMKAIGGDDCGLTGWTKPGEQDQIGFEGAVKMSAAQSAAAQLVLWEIAYDFDGKDLHSLNLDAGNFITGGSALSINGGELRHAYDDLVGKLSLDGLKPADAAHPLSVVIGDNLYGNDGHDTFAFGRGDGVDMIWDFQAGTDIVEVSGYRIEDVSAFTFVTDVVDNGRDGTHPLNAGSHQKLAVILDRGGDAITFNDVGNRDSTAAAMRFDNGTLSMKELWARAEAAQHVAAPAPTGPVQDEVAAAIKVTGSWWGGFQGEITVTARHDLASWDVALGTKWNVQNVWNAVNAGHVNDAHGVVFDLDDAGWNGHLAAGQTATIGFTASTGVNGEISTQQIMDGLWIG